MALHTPTHTHLDTQTHTHIKNQPQVLEEGYAFCPSATYTVPPAETAKDFVAAISCYPLAPAPDIFGLHDNADITCEQVCEGLRGHPWLQLDTIKGSRHASPSMRAGVHTLNDSTLNDGNEASLGFPSRGLLVRGLNRLAAGWRWRAIAASPLSHPSRPYAPSPDTHPRPSPIRRCRRCWRCSRAPRAAAAGARRTRYCAQRPASWSG